LSLIIKVVLELENLPAGVYGLTLSDANGCLYVCGLVINEPAPVLCSTEVTQAPDNPDLYFITVTATGGEGDLQYSIDDGVTYQNSNVFDGLTPGTYNVLIMDETTCTSTCGPIEVGQRSRSVSSAPLANLSPNPASDVMNVAYITPVETFTIFEVKDLSGSVIYHKEMNTTTGENTFSLDTSNYPNGTYFLAIYNDRDVETIQFTVFRRYR